ncbi:MAG: hypothetical protein WDO73_05330 [Ignavibacteriota bacterium]
MAAHAWEQDDFELFGGVAAEALLDAAAQSRSEMTSADHLFGARQKKPYFARQK